MTIRFTLLAALLLAAGCASWRPAPKSLAAHGVLLERMGDDILCVVNTKEDGDGATWYLLGDGGHWNERLGTSLSAMGRVHELAASPDGRCLAVVSVGEGHPYLEVVDLPLLLHDKQWKVLQEIDPYPGGIGIERWDGDQLVVLCDMLLTHRGKDGRVQAALELESAERFALDAATGAILARSRGAREPVRHYIGMLSAADAGERGMAIEALKALRSPSALPALRARLERERDPDLRTALRETLDELSR